MQIFSFECTHPYLYANFKKVNLFTQGWQESKTKRYRAAVQPDYLSPNLKLNLTQLD